jgi:hypothetical protein
VGSNPTPSVFGEHCELATYAVSRGKSPIHVGSERAGPRMAALRSIVETCPRLKLRVRDFPIHRIAKECTGSALTRVPRCAQDSGCE